MILTINVKISLHFLLFGGHSGGLVQDNFFFRGWQKSIQHMKGFNQGNKKQNLSWIFVIHWLRRCKPRILMTVGGQKCYAQLCLQWVPENPPLLFPMTLVALWFSDIRSTTLTTSTYPSLVIADVIQCVFSCHSMLLDTLHIALPTFS